MATASLIAPIRSALVRRPGLYLPLARRRYGDRVLGPGTELVIEGFPRSANTFAVTAFTLAQDRAVGIAHHLHEPVHVQAAVRAGVPVLLLVREPLDAVVSSVNRKPALDPVQQLRRYVDFHRRTLPCAAGMVVATFEQVTTDFGAVTDRVNRRFGTSFTPFVHDDAGVAACFARIDGWSRERAGGLDDAVVARPTARRAASRPADRDSLAARAGADLLAQASRLHEAFRALAENG